MPETIDWFLGPQIKELDSIRRPDENWHKGATLRCDLAPLVASAHVPSRGQFIDANPVRQSGKCRDVRLTRTKTLSPRVPPLSDTSLNALVGTPRHVTAPFAPANRSQTRAPGNSRRYDHHHDDALLALRPSRLVRTGAVASTGSSVCFCQGFQ